MLSGVGWVRHKRLCMRKFSVPITSQKLCFDVEKDDPLHPTKNLWSKNLSGRSTCMTWTKPLDSWLTGLSSPIRALSNENKTTRLSVTQSSWAFEVPRRNTMHTAAGLLLYTATEVDLLLHSLRGLGKQWHWTVWRGVTLHLICFQLWGGGPCLLREISWGKKTERHANLKIIEMKSTTYDMVIVWSWWYDTR